MAMTQFRLKSLTAAVLILTTVSCAKVTHTTPPAAEIEEAIPTSLPAYQGAKQRILICPWNISKIDLEKYPYLRQKRIGFGINNRMFEALYQSGRFDVIEEREPITAKITGADKSPDYDYIVYPEVYHFGIENDTDISGVAVTANAVTELGVQIVFVNAKTGVTATVGSAIGSIKKTNQGDISDDLEQTAFSQSIVGKAADKAIIGALSRALTRLNPTESASSIADTTLNRKSVAVVDLAPTTKNSVIVRHADKSNQQGQSGRFFAFVIGNNEYGSFPRLKTALNDAEKVEHLLREEYGYETQLLLNGTRQTIIDRLDKLRNELSENDNLLIYYAGHGYYDPAAERGYWLPVNSTAENTSEWISNPDVTDKIKALKAKHVLVVADSCFSGTLTRGVKVVLGGETSASKTLPKNSVNKRSRTALASGGLEPVLDGGGGVNSVFAKAFIDTLAENKAEINGTDLFNKIHQKVTTASPQTPQYSDIKFAGHDGGEFVFKRLDKD